MAKFSSWHKINRSWYTAFVQLTPTVFKSGILEAFFFILDILDVHITWILSFEVFFLKKITRLVHHLSTCLFTIVQKITV